MNKYRILHDKGDKWSGSTRKDHNCFICKRIILSEEDAYWVTNEYQGLTGILRLTCSEECANMYILQNMDKNDKMVYLAGNDF